MGIQSRKKRCDPIVLGLHGLGLSKILNDVIVWDQTDCPMPVAQVGRCGATLNHCFGSVPHTGSSLII